MATALLALQITQISPAGPNRQPQLAAGMDGGDGVRVGRGDLAGAILDNGKTFAAPVKVRSCRRCCWAGIAVRGWPLRAARW